MSKTSGLSNDEFHTIVQRASKSMSRKMLKELHGIDAVVSRGICLASIWDLARLLEEALPPGDCAPLQEAIHAVFSPDSGMFELETLH